MIFPIKFVNWLPHSDDKLTSCHFKGSFYLIYIYNFCYPHLLPAGYRDLCPTWYQTMVYKLLYCNPAVKSYDLQYHTQVRTETQNLTCTEFIFLFLFTSDLLVPVTESDYCLTVLFSVSVTQVTVSMMESNSCMTILTVEYCSCQWQSEGVAWQHTSVSLSHWWQLAALCQ